MDNDYTLQELADQLVKLGRKRHGLDCAYPYALGTIIGMVDFHVKYNPERLQAVINERYNFTQQELANAH